MSLADELQKLKDLHTSGALTDADYSAAKSQLLGTGAAPSTAPPPPHSPPTASPSPQAAPRGPVLPQPATGVPAKKKGTSVAFLVIAVPLGLLLGLIIAGRIIAGATSTTGGGPMSSPLNLIAPPEVVFDEDMAISASGGAQMRSFNLTRNAPVRIEIQGKADTDKGFDVDLIDPQQWDAVKGGGTFTHFVEYSAPKVKTYRKTGTLNAGTYGLVVSNRYNIFNTMIVHVKVTANPK